MKQTVKFSIKYKMIMLTVVLSLTAIISVSYFFLLAIKKQTGRNIEKVSELTDVLAEDTYQSTLQNASDYNGKIVSRQAKNTDEKLRNLREKTELIAKMFEKAYVYSGISYDENAGVGDDSSYVEDDELDKIYFLAPGVVSDEQIRQEERAVSPALDAMMDYALKNPVCANVFYLSKTGITAQANGAQSYKEYDLRQISPPYLSAMETPGTFVWEDVYTDRISGLCLSGAISFNGADGKPAGVIVLDVYMDDFAPAIDESKIGESGKVFILASTKDGNQIMPANALGEYVDTNEHWAEIFKETWENDSGRINTEYNRRSYYLYYDTVKETNWRLCSMIADSEIARTSNHVQGKLENTVNDIKSNNENSMDYIIISALFAIIVFTILILIASIIFANKLSNPILNLADGTEIVGEGNLDVELPIETNDEIGELTHMINQMIRNLKEYVNELTATTAAKEKVEAEMSMAAQIQDGMIPDEPIDINGTHIEGLMRPAKSVGGDFFDYFMIDDDHLAFLIADVSDKGVPAALFMAIGRTLIREEALTGIPLSEVFFKVNNILTRNNENMQFITVFSGILELSTGVMRYANAGHEKPFIKRKNGNFEVIETQSSMPLGLMADIDYPEGTIKLEDGELFFQYTDGATDSVNPEGIMLEEEGVEKMLNSIVASELIKNEKADFVNCMLKHIDEHAACADQFDDITLLLVAFNFDK